MPPISEPKPKRARNDWKLSEKIWLPNFRSNYPKLNAAELGVELTAADMCELSLLENLSLGAKKQVDNRSSMKS
jgi:hypothetical protein